jgi:hypothetical protein
MKMRTTVLFCAAALVAVCVPADAADPEMLASAKSLYESASYEAALSEFSAIQTIELADTVDTYKALCLLGLGRVRDAEQALELVVTRQPLLVLNDAEYSPRVVALFREVRKKALPAAAQQLYMAARTEYENKKYDAAAAGFKQALQVIAEIGPDSQTTTLADLKELASGFATLADAKITAQTAPPPRVAAPAPAAAPAPPPAAAAAAMMGPAFYTLADIDVTPPVAVAQQIPPWTFTTGYAPNRAFSGVLEVLIDENGKVETATLAEPVWPPYDLVLLSAAKRWQYQPAVRQGKSVKFKRTLVINIDPGAQRPR